MKHSFLDEYIVRTNALLLAQKYFKDAEFNSDIVEGGFIILDNVLEFTKENYKGYPNYEAF